MVIKQKGITERYAAILFLALQGMTGGVTRSLSTLVDTPFIKI